VAESFETALRATLSDVRVRIAELRTRRKRASEQETRELLVEPVLTALGWPLADPDLVRREARTRGPAKVVSYALLYGGQPCLLVGVRPLAEVLTRESTAALLDYAATTGVGWCVLTNGDTWRLSYAQAQVDLEEKLFAAAQLSDPEEDERCVATLALCARQRPSELELERLWRSAYADRRVGAALETLAAADGEALAHLVRRHAGGLSLAAVRASLSRAQVSARFPAPRLLAPLAMAPAANPTAGRRQPPRPESVTLADLITSGHVRPPLALEKRFQGVPLRASLEAGGRIAFSGAHYDSPAAAAAAARAAVSGAPAAARRAPDDGWSFWQYREPTGGQLHLLDELRRQYLAQQG
jgi:hypothetical protein